MSRRELPWWTLPVSYACLVAWAVIMALALVGCSVGEQGSTWPESDEFAHIETGADRFSVHGTNLNYWYVVVDHSTGVQYLCRYKHGITPLLDADGTPLLVLEAGE